MVTATTVNSGFVHSIGSSSRSEETFNLLTPTGDRAPLYDPAGTGASAQFSQILAQILHRSGDDVNRHRASFESGFHRS
jgi:hypothetical protein